MKTAVFSFFLFVSLSSGAQAQHSDWPKYCSNLEMTGVANSGGAISPTTLSYLVPRWTIKLGGPVASSPTIAGDIVYIGDWSGVESALSAADGSVVAQANLGTTTAPQCDVSAIGITSAAAVQNGIVYVAGGDDSFYALDALTLAVRWRRSLGDNSAGGGYYGWCSPALTNFSVLQGVSSYCDNPLVPGRVVVLDLTDGSVINDMPMVQPDWPQTVIGGGVWTSPAVDTVNHDIFVTTGSARNPEDGLSYSMVRISLDTLTVVESWKADVRQDDSDWGTSPTLFSDSTGRQFVGAGQKDGYYFAFARRNVGEGPVWRTQLAGAGACPFCGDGVLSTAAFDGTRLYVGGGKPVDVDGAVGSVVALDPATGAILWRQTFGSPVIAPISYTNGVVFATVGDSAIALNAESGALLWRFETSAQCVGGVAITDRGIYFGDLAGNLYHMAVVTPLRARAVRDR